MQKIKHSVDAQHMEPMGGMRQSSAEDQKADGLAERGEAQLLG